MYEIAKFIVYKFTVYCIVCSKFKSTLNSLQQIVATYKSLTNQWAIMLFPYMKKNMLQHYLAFCDTVI